VRTTIASQNKRAPPNFSLKERFDRDAFSLAFYGMGRLSHGNAGDMTMNVGKAERSARDGKITAFRLICEIALRSILGEVTKTGVDHSMGRLATAFYSTGNPKASRCSQSCRLRIKDDEGTATSKAACHQTFSGLSAKRNSRRRAQ